MKKSETVKVQENFVNNIKLIMSKSKNSGENLTLEESLEITKGLEKEIQTVLEHMKNDNNSLNKKEKGGNFMTCTMCKKDVDLINDDLIEVQGDKICKNCLENKFRLDVVCEKCQLEYDGLNSFVELNDTVYCLNCAIDDLGVKAD